MSITRPKLLRFPNGFQMTSDQIERVDVYPDMSPARTVPYVRVFDLRGPVYQGLVDLDRIEVHDGAATTSDAGAIRALAVARRASVA